MVERRFPRQIDQQACTCRELPPIDTPEELTSGTIEVVSYDGMQLIVEINAGEYSRGTLINHCPPVFPPGT